MSCLCLYVEDVTFFCELMQKCRVWIHENLLGKGSGFQNVPFANILCFLNWVALTWVICNVPVERDCMKQEKYTPVTVWSFVSTLYLHWHSRPPCTKTTCISSLWVAELMTQLLFWSAGVFHHLQVSTAITEDSSTKKKKKKILETLINTNILQKLSWNRKEVGLIMLSYSCPLPNVLCWQSLLDLYDIWWATSQYG